ncbi:unnamed protein product [Coccothraustes coccothraustes]
MDGLELLMNVPISRAGSSRRDEPNLLVPRVGHQDRIQPSGEDSAIRRGFSLFPQLPPPPAQRRRAERSPRCPNPLRRFQVNILFLIKSRGYWSLKVHGREETRYEPLAASGCRTQPPRTPAGL